MADRRIVYGARCVWWGSIFETASSPTGLPICPSCGSPLFEVGCIEVWWDGVDRHEADGHPGYRRMLEWGRGQCFPSMMELEAAFLASVIT